MVLESKRNARSAVSTFSASCITIAELYENMGRIVGRDVVRLRISSMKDSGIEFVPIDAEIAEIAGDLKLNFGDLPMADAIIAATARQLADGRLISDDDHFRSMKNLKLSWID